MRMMITKPLRWLIQFSSVLLVLNWALAHEIDGVKERGVSCQRIVSVSPALSDMLWELELDDNIVGSTRYCQLPALESREIVGGYFDLNIEKVASLVPDIVFLEGLPNNPISRKLDALGIQNRVFPLDTLEEISAAKQEIATYCHSDITVSSETLREHLAGYVPPREASDKKPRVLILYNYGDNAAKVLPRLAAGRSFHGELLTALGMDNVYLGSLNAPELTRESISLLNPEWIFIFNSLIGDSTAGRDRLDIERVQPKWEFLSGVDAVQHQRVYEIKGFYTQIPSVMAMRKLGAIFAKLVYQKEESSPVKMP